MGLPELFDIITDYEATTLIAQLAEDHHRRHGRPLRIAVDEADWRFNNLTQAQVYAIRDASDMAYQGQEKLMFYRICRLLTLNIQLIFVFDGPARPWKRGGRGGGKIDFRKRDLLKEVLRCFGIPYHEAPGEAEAECARLQVLDLVDAVWSQDSDCLMFGCTWWIRDDRVAKEKGSKDRSKENTEKSKKTVRVVKAKDLKARLKLDREGLVLFAMLVGGDYDGKGLPGCGSSTAMRIIKKGLGQSLCMCQNQRDCDAWSARLTEALHSSGGGRIVVPSGFPSFKTLAKYNSPKVSDDGTLLSKSILKLDNMRPIDEPKLLETTSSRFNIWGKLYMNWIGPVLLTRFLASRSSSLPQEVVHDIKLTKSRVKKDEVALPTRAFDRKLSFSPFGVTTLQRQDFEGEKLGYWNRSVTIPFDPGHRVDCEIPTYWLEKVLPPAVLNPPPTESGTKSVKRKQREDGHQSSETPTTAKRKRKVPETALSASPSLGEIPTVTPTRSIRKAGQDTPSSRFSNKTSHVGHVKNTIELSDSNEELRLPPSRPQFSSVRSARAQVVDFGSPSQSDEDIELNTDATNKNSNRLDEFLRAIPTQANLWSNELEEDDRDLQLALRLSVQTNTSATCSSHDQRDFTSTLSRAFADPDPRNDMRSRIPYRSNKQQAHSPKTSSSGQLRDQESVKHKPSNSARSHQRATDQTTKTPSKLALLSPEEDSTVAPPTFLNPDNTQASSLSMDDIRAARVRHFQSATNSTLANRTTTTTASSMAPEQAVQSSFHIPEGYDCIDLTSD